MLGLGLMVISGIFTVIGMILSSRLRNKFQMYAQVPLQNGRSGAEVAAAMLHHYGLHNVQITQVDGELTDHYNPMNRTVNLSADVYHGRHVAAAAVAAHECGHAVQHATQYSMLQLRSAIVPVVNIAAGVQQYIFMFGAAGAAATNNLLFVFIALLVFGVTAMFSLITLPVEFDASRRALAWLNESGFSRGREHEGAKDALWWAAMTYVAAALAALVQLIYIATMLLGGRRNEE
jgi:uncharacterized protein